jgi:DNA-binding CsgD family transcriptional regulator
VKNEFPLTKKDFDDVASISDIISDISDASLSTSQIAITNVLLEIFQAESGVFFLRNIENQSINKKHTVFKNIDLEYVTQYQNYYHRIDPFLKRMPSSHACREIDLMPRSKLLELEIYNDFIKPQGINQQLCLYLQDQFQLIGHVGIHRYSKNSKPFSQVDLFKAGLIARFISLGLRQRRKFNHYNGKSEDRTDEYYPGGLLFMKEKVNTVYWKPNPSRESPGVLAQTYPQLKIKPFQRCKSVLTGREAEIFELLIQGFSNLAICEQLFISLPTVTTHIRHIYEKLGVTRRTLMSRVLTR